MAFNDTIKNKSNRIRQYVMFGVDLVVSSFTYSQNYDFTYLKWVISIQADYFSILGAYKVNLLNGEVEDFLNTDLPSLPIPDQGYFVVSGTNEVPKTIEIYSSSPINSNEKIYIKAIFKITNNAFLKEITNNPIAITPSTTINGVYYPFLENNVDISKDIKIEGDKLASYSPIQIKMKAFGSFKNILSNNTYFKDNQVVVFLENKDSYKFVYKGVFDSIKLENGFISIGFVSYEKIFDAFISGTSDTDSGYYGELSDDVFGAGNSVLRIYDDFGIDYSVSPHTPYSMSKTNTVLSGIDVYDPVPETMLIAKPKTLNEPFSTTNNRELYVTSFNQAITSFEVEYVDNTDPNYTIIRLQQYSNAESGLIIGGYYVFYNFVPPNEVDSGVCIKIVGVDLYFTKMPNVFITNRITEENLGYPIAFIRDDKGYFRRLLYQRDYEVVASILPTDPNPVLMVLSSGFETNFLDITAFNPSLNEIRYVKNGYKPESESASQFFSEFLLSKINDNLGSFVSVNYLKTLPQTSLINTQPFYFLSPFFKNQTIIKIKEVLNSFAQNIFGFFDINETTGELEFFRFFDFDNIYSVLITNDLIINSVKVDFIQPETLSYKILNPNKYGREKYSKTFFTNKKTEENNFQELIVYSDSSSHQDIPTTPRISDTSFIYFYIQHLLNRRAYISFSLPSYFMDIKLGDMLKISKDVFDFGNSLFEFYYVCVVSVGFTDNMIKIVAVDFNEDWYDAFQP